MSKTSTEPSFTGWPSSMLLSSSCRRLQRPLVQLRMTAAQQHNR
jgi:hypothetical protein